MELRQGDAAGNCASGGVYGDGDKDGADTSEIRDFLHDGVGHKSSTLDVFMNIEGVDLGQCVVLKTVAVAGEIQVNVAVLLDLVPAEGVGEKTGRNLHEQRAAGFRRKAVGNGANDGEDADTVPVKRIFYKACGKVVIVRFKKRIKEITGGQLF